MSSSYLAERMTELGIQFGFTLDDLAANRQRKATPVQLDRLFELAPAQNPPMVRDAHIEVVSLVCHYSPSHHQAAMGQDTEDKCTLFFSIDGHAAVYSHTLTPITTIEAGDYCIYIVVHGTAEYILSIEPIFSYRYLDPYGNLRPDAFDNLLFLLYRTGDVDGYAGRLGSQLTWLYGQDAVIWDFSPFDLALRAQAMRLAIEKCHAAILLVGPEFDSIESILAYQNEDDLFRIATKTIDSSDAAEVAFLINDIPIPPIAKEAFDSLDEYWQLNDQTYRYDTQCLVANFDNYADIFEGAVSHLSRKFQYDDVDLSSNIARRVSRGQLNWLARRDMRWFAWASVYVLPPIAFLVIAIGIWSSVHWFAIVSLVVAAILFGVGFGTGFWQTFLFRKIKIIEGNIELSERFMPDRVAIRTANNTVITVRFPFDAVLSKTEWRALALRQYTIYYCTVDQTNFLLSLLPVQKGDVAVPSHLAAPSWPI